MTIGARAMGGSVDEQEYWTSREKWTMMHYFRADGYTPTEEGVHIVPFPFWSQFKFVFPV